MGTLNYQSTDLESMEMEQVVPESVPETIQESTEPIAEKLDEVE